MFGGLCCCLLGSVDCVCVLGFAAWCKSGGFGWLICLVVIVVLA